MYDLSKKSNNVKHCYTSNSAFNDITISYHEQLVMSFEVHRFGTQTLLMLSYCVVAEEALNFLHTFTNEVSVQITHNRSIKLEIRQTAVKRAQGISMHVLA